MSILSDIRKSVGGDVNGTDFDLDLVININSSISILTQLGVGPKGGFRITQDGDEDWASLTGESKLLEMIKTYVYLKAKIVFDPPQNASTLNAFKEEIKEYEWRIPVAIETKEVF